MKLFLKITSYALVAIQVMLLFLLFFQNKLSLPPWLQAIGRMHPMLLHLPIGMVILAGLLWMFQRNFKQPDFNSIFGFLLYIAAFTASLTALMGFFLSKEGGYNEEILNWHKWTGIGVSLCCCLLLLLFHYAPQRKILFTSSMIAAIAIIIIAGHYGSDLTHGEGYVLQPLEGTEGEEHIIITDSTDLYTAAIRPILKAKCFSCHNDQKAKGDLSMTSLAALLKGGKDGPLWIAGDAVNSHIIQKINLPEEDKKHMPPSGKPQLTDPEKALLYTWVQQGADMKKTLKEYDTNDTLYKLATTFIYQAEDPVKEEIAYPFAPASAEVVKKINTPFCVVTPLSINSPALQASFFVREKFDPKKLTELLSIKEQLVILDLAHMPVKDEDLKLIAGFSNLEKLNLDNTDITAKTLPELGKLKNLHSLALAGTKVDKTIFAMLPLFPALKEIFLWNTNTGEADSLLAKPYKNIAFNFGYTPDTAEVLKLNPPLVKNENFVLDDTSAIILTHALPGTTIRYTIDGTEPDSAASPIYSGPLRIQSYTPVKAIAVKNRWYASDVITSSFFRKGIPAQSAELVNEPDDPYKGAGARILIDAGKGTIDNLRDSNWLGFRQKPFAAYIYFNGAPQVSNITISYAKIPFFYIMPPASIEIWAGTDKQHLKQIKKLNPPPLKQMEGSSIGGINIPLTPGSYACYKIMVMPVPHLPQWHPGKGEKGWFFIDEIFFN